MTPEELIKKFPAAAEYLIQIFIVKRDYGVVKNSVIASRLGVSKPAVTQAMNRLKRYNLIEQDLYGAINLTPFGRLNAAVFLKRHYLLEHLLIKKLDYNWVKSDEEASRLQASISDSFTDFLYEKLGRPQTCPHGNPFPDSPSENTIIQAIGINNAAVGEPLEVVRITEEGEASEGLLQFCYENNIRPGEKIEVIEAEDSGILVNTGAVKNLLIPSDFAGFIRCS